MKMVMYSLKILVQPYYYNTKTGRFPNIEGPNFVDNFDRIEDQADVYLKAPEDLATHVFIPEKNSQRYVGGWCSHSSHCWLPIETSSAKKVES